MHRVRCPRLRSWGVSLKKLADASSTGDPRWTPNLHKLAATLNINGGVRKDQPLVGDIIFWNYTYERKINADGSPRETNCLLGDEEQPTHVGIVLFVDNLGDVHFAHAGNPATRGFMSVRDPDSVALNSFLRSWPKNNCPLDAQPDRASAGVGISPLAGKLFNGYATIRDIK